MSEHPLEYAAIAIALPVSKLYHYRIPDELLDFLEPGHAVLVPFGIRQVSGFVIERVLKPGIEPSRIKTIARLLTPHPVFDSSLLPFFGWIANYYHHPLGEVIRTALPAGLLIESRLTCRLTDAGLARLSNKDNLPHDELELLTSLLTRAGVAWNHLIRRKDLPNVANLVRQLERRGLVLLEQKLGSQTVQPRYREIYRPTGSISGGDLKGKLQKTVLQILLEFGEADLAELREILEIRGTDSKRLPSVLKRLRVLGAVESEMRELWRDGKKEFELEDPNHELSSHQMAAISAIREKLDKGQFQACVLHGVTGSGKTEVYLRVVAEALAHGRGAIILVPEISLTPQLVGRFRARFGDQVACLHSGLSTGERFDGWRRLQLGLARVAIGARSALFAPVADLGVLVVDEEHDSSFKQDTGLRYNARDLAVVRAKQAGGLALLGSATPSLETIANCARGRFSRLNLPERIARSLPRVHIVNMARSDSRPRLDESPFSPALEEAFSASLAAGQQVILLLNRRGYAPFVLCSGCGGSFRCLHCDISLTYHRHRHILLCHYCGFGQTLPDRCPHCAEKTLELIGQGTERLVDWLVQQYSAIKIGRLDRDIVASKGAHFRILDAFRRKETQVLVGTQMVVKGHDFPSVTLVGVLQADHALNMPDFRAAERTFQLVTQVAGRAGRGDAPGNVFVQTFSPNHPSIRFAASHDSNGFYRHEMRRRRAHRYPPYSRLALLRVSSKDREIAKFRAQELAAALRQGVDQRGPEQVEVLGPAPAPLARLEGWYRWQVLIKAPTIVPIQRLLTQLERQIRLLGRSPDVRVAIDVDPQNLL